MVFGDNALRLLGVDEFDDFDLDRLQDDFDDDDCLFDFQELCRSITIESSSPKRKPTTHIFVERMNDAMAAQLGTALIMSVNNNRRCSAVGGGVQYMDLMISDLTATAGNYQSLLDVCRNSVTLRAVKLSSAMFGCVTACAQVTSHFVNALACNNNLQEVELYNVTVSVDSLAVLLSHSNLQKLVLQYCDFAGAPEALTATGGDSGRAVLRDGTKNRKTMLNTLECTCIDERYMAAILGHAAYHSRNLQRSTIAAHRATAVSTRAIGHFLQSATNMLSELELMNFDFQGGDLLFAPIAEGIAAATSITKLGFEYCQFGGASLLQLESLLTSPSSCHLETLTLGGPANMLDNPLFLANVIQRNGSLRRLDLNRCCGANNFDFGALLQALHSNTTLQRLSLGYVLDHSHCESLIYHLPKITSLRYLSVELEPTYLDNTSNKEAWSRALRRNSSLLVVDWRRSLKNDNDICSRIIQQLCARNKFLAAMTAPGSLDSLVGVNSLWPRILNAAGQTENGAAAIFNIIQALTGGGVIGPE